MTIEKEVIVNKEIEKAWDVIAVQFADAYKWASPVNHSEGKGAGTNGAACSERGCATSMGKLKEKILEYSNENHVISWQAVEGMPSMVKLAKNTWKLTAIGQERTRVNMKMDIEVGGVMGFLMKPMMKMQMDGMGTALTEDFKYYVENGRPSVRKMKAMGKLRR